MSNYNLIQDCMHFFKDVSKSGNMSKILYDWRFTIINNDGKKLVYKVCYWYSKKSGKYRVKLNNNKIVELNKNQISQLMKEGFILLKNPIKIALALQNERIDLLLDDEYFEQYQQLAFDYQKLNDGGFDRYTIFDSKKDSLNELSSQQQDNGYSNLISVEQNNFSKDRVRTSILQDDKIYSYFVQNNNSKSNNNDSNKYVFDFESNSVIERDYQLDDKEEFGSSNSSDIDPTESKPPTFSSFDQFFAFPPQNQVEQKQQLQANQNRQPPVKRALRLSQIGDLLQLEPVNYNDNPFQRQSSGNSTEDQSPINDQFNQSNNNFCNSQFREQQQSILSPNSSMMKGMNLFNYNQTLNMTSPKALSTEHFNQFLPINQGNIQHSMQYIVGQIEGKQASYYLEREQQMKLKETQNKKIDDVFGQMFQMQLSKQ